MNESVTISKLNNQINILNSELKKSKLKSSELENSLIKLQKDYTDLKVRFYLSASKEVEYQNMKINLKEKNKIISDLEKEIAFIRRDFEQQKKAFNAKYQHDVEDIRFINEKLNIRNETAIKYEKLNSLLYEQVLQLEKTILNFKNEEKRRLDEQELKFDKKLSDTKKKMLDFINKGKYLKNIHSKKKFEIVEKFSIINHNSLLNELEFESLQLEDLLKQREHLDQVIAQMKADISIHRNVEKVLVNKNKKYIDMIKILSEKIEKDKKEKEIETEKKDQMIRINKINDTFKDKERQFFYNTIKKNIDTNNRANRYSTANKILSNSYSIIKLSDFTNTKINKTNYNTKFLKRNQSSQNFVECKTKTERITYEKILLQKELIKKTKEIDILRRDYNHYKDKTDYINRRFSNIIGLFDIALEKIYKENIEDLKDIFIDFNDFKQCDFEKLSPEKKYSIIILLIECILPLINENNLPENIKKNMRNTQTKYYLNETNDSSCKAKNFNTTFFDINMRENENKLREFRDGTWNKLKLKSKSKKRNKNKEENVN